MKSMAAGAVTEVSVSDKVGAMVSFNDYADSGKKVR